MATQSDQDKKWALVTGASSGLGAEFSDQLAERGFNLVLTARRVERLLERKRMLEQKYGVRVEVIPSDLARLSAPSELYREVLARGIEVSVLINNAGYGIHGDFVDSSLDDLKAMLQLDIVALTELTHLFAQAMKARNTGHILLVSSIGAYQPSPTYAAYSAAKAYVLSFGEALNAELRSFGVLVSVLSPGVTATEFLERAGQSPTLYQRLVMMKSPIVVRVGLKALFRGTPSVLPGFVNRLSVFMLRFMPRTWQTHTARLLMKG